MTPFASPRRTVVIAASAALTAVTLAACSHSVSGTPAARSGHSTVVAAPSTTPASATVPTPGPTQQPSAQLVQNVTGIALRTSDFDNGMSVTLMPDGDSLAGTTLDVCNASFSTEADRVVRRQYNVVQGGQSVGVSNEVVAYDTAAHAEEAITQAYQAAQTCKPSVVVQDNGQNVTVQQHVLRNQRNTGTVPAPSNLLIVDQEQASGQTGYAAAIYQVHGRYLDGTYGVQDHAFTSADLQALAELATVTGNRLMHTSS